MITKLVKHKKGYALVIDQTYLELLRIDPQQPVEVSTDGTTLTIRRATAADICSAQEFHEALKKVNRRYGRAMRMLAEGDAKQ